MNEERQILLFLRITPDNHNGSSKYLSWTTTRHKRDKILRTEKH